MLALPFYYLVFGGTAFGIGLLAYRLWDRGETNLRTEVISDPDWLFKKARQEPNTNQSLYEFSVQYIAVLKGVFAAPSASKLERLSKLFAAPQNSDDQLWKDMSLRLDEAYNSYSLEYVALIETIATHSQNPSQLYAAHRLATCIGGSSRKLISLGKAIAQNPILTGSLKQ